MTYYILMINFTKIEFLFLQISDENIRECAKENENCFGCRETSLNVP